MSASVQTIRLAVVLARRAVDNPWIDHSWSASGVIANAPNIPDWTVLREEGGLTQFHAGFMDLVLYKDQTEGYKVNLSNPIPSVYVVISKDEEGDHPHDVFPFLITACPYEAESYEEGGDDLVEAVEMPLEVLAQVTAFIDEFHIDTPFKKRKRKPFDPRKEGFGGRRSRVGGE